MSIWYCMLLGVSASDLARMGGGTLPTHVSGGDESLPGLYPPSPLYEILHSVTCFTKSLVGTNKLCALPCASLCLGHLRLPGFSLCRTSLGRIGRYPMASREAYQSLLANEQPASPLSSDSGVMSSAEFVSLLSASD